ncbi:hypothetical protein D9M73_134570 [compost metagenome]
MAQSREARQIEKTAAAFHRMDEAKDRIEPVAIVRRGFPCDDFARERFERLTRLGDEFL